MKKDRIVKFDNGFCVDISRIYAISQQQELDGKKFFIVYFDFQQLRVDNENFSRDKLIKKWIEWNEK